MRRGRDRRMTTDRKLARALATLRAVEGDLLALAEEDPDPGARHAFAEEARRAGAMAARLEERLRRVRHEEPQYAEGGEPR